MVSISSPLLAFLFVDRFGLKPTLLLDSLTFFLSFLLLFSIRDVETHVEKHTDGTSVKAIWQDIIEGMKFIIKEKEIFFLLAIASFVNFFISAFNYLVPFTNQLFDNSASYATLLTMGAAGAIVGALLANKLFKNSYGSILIALALCGVGLMLITVFAVLKLPVIIIVSGDFVFEFFLTVFNIHFFSMVQKKVPDFMLGRVFSSIFTVAVVFMPISTMIMTVLPFSVHIVTFAIIGLGVLLVSIGGFVYSRNFMI